MKTLNRSATIRQTSSGWYWTDMNRRYKSAAAAFRAVGRDDRRILESGIFDAIITMIEWEPTTEVGTMAVRALQPEPGE